ncbi:hypothetical protein Bca101_082690 [Brassica carinata]
MALYTEPGSWRGFLEQVSGPGTQFGNDETQPPSPQPPSPQIEIDDVPVPNAPTIPVELMTLDELLLALGRSDLPKIHPNRVNGAGWYEVKVIKNGRRFGYGTMDIGDTSGPSYATQSPDYKALYLETQTKLIQVKSKCDELSSQVEDALYWSTFMRNMYPDHVPPSKAARQAATADNTFEA